MLEAGEDFNPGSVPSHSRRETFDSTIKKGKKLFGKAQSAGRKFVEFRKKAQKSFGELTEDRSDRFNPFGTQEPVGFSRGKKKFVQSGRTINPFGEPTNEDIGLLRSPTAQRPISERLRDLEGRMDNNIFGKRARGLEESMFGIKRGNRGQATIEAIFAIFVFAVIGFAILPLYYQILNSFLIPAIQDEAFGSINVLIWQTLPVIVMAGMAFAVFNFFKPKLRQV